MEEREKIEHIRSLSMISKLLDEAMYPLGTVIFNFHLKELLGDDPWKVYVKNVEKFWEALMMLFKGKEEIVRSAITYMVSYVNEHYNTNYDPEEFYRAFKEGDLGYIRAFIAGLEKRSEVK